MVHIIKKGTSTTEVKKLLATQQLKRRLRAKKYLGVINLKKDALKIQYELRNEWK
jgi:hypothetical protein